VSESRRPRFGRHFAASVIATAVWLSVEAQQGAAGTTIVDDTTRSQQVSRCQTIRPQHSWPWYEAKLDPQHEGAQVVSQQAGAHAGW